MWFCVCKQKTAYERRISDWSSDVCSSDLYPMAHVHRLRRRRRGATRGRRGALRALGRAPRMNSTFEARLKAQALGMGFDLAGIATLGPADTTADRKSGV